MSRSRLSTEWLDIIGDGFLACGCHPTAAPQLPEPVVVAQVRGLLLDLDATGDKRRIERAYEDFMMILAQSPGLPAPASPAPHTRR